MKPASNRADKTARLRLRIAPAAETALRGGHPWVFADRVKEQNRDAHAGELAVIYDRHDRFLAIGLFDPDSPIRVRVLHVGKPLTIDRAWWAQRLAQSVGRRRGLFDEETTGYRLINGESDGWPGLVLDRYGSTLVLKIYTNVWWPWLGEIVELVREQLEPERIVLRTSRNVERRPPARPDGELLFEKRAESEIGVPIVFLESGLRFEADVWRGQKTGFFLDQRENRRLVGSLARGRRVLNAFSFSGGFSLYAARGGAVSVTDLDISRHALDSARRNFALNSADRAAARCRHEVVQADAFEWLAKNSGASFDLIVLDPPSFAKREADRAEAIRGYGRLISLGLERLARGGILVACSCSAHVSAAEFFQAARRNVAKSGKKFEELKTTGHPPDHPATFKEAEYLKGIYLRV